ncbi:MAG TPA: 4Fe-4S binding protein [Terriglobales bacterium]|nr:4Fe-4S binding protein [Terriglobales bacterium]
MSAQPHITDIPSPETLQDRVGTHGQPEAKTKKRLVRRTDVDRSQLIRRGVQFAFVALNIYLGVQFYGWVRFYETAGESRFVSRPAGVEGWLPIAALMNLKYFLLTGLIPQIHPAGMFLLIAFLAMSLLLRKSFCSWLCPVGTFSEYLWKLGRRTFRRNFSLPRWLDLPLRGLKYLLLGLFVYVIAKMDATAIRDFLGSPYGLIADVKMLNFFRFMSETAAITIGVLAILSIFVQNFWCRFLCPYGALLGLVSLLSPAKIRRNEQACIDCAKCAKACPSRLPVDKLVQIRSAECTSCLECVAVCPAKDALNFELPRRRRLSPAVVAATIAIIFLGVVSYAKLTGHWETHLATDLHATGAIGE